MAREVEAHAVAAVQFGACVGLIFARKMPKRRNASEPDITAARENSGGDAVKGAAEIIGVNGRFVGYPIAIGILK